MPQSSVLQGCWASELSSSCLHNKHFTNSDIFPALVRVLGKVLFLCWAQLHHCKVRKGGGHQLGKIQSNETSLHIGCVVPVSAFCGLRQTDFFMTMNYFLSTIRMCKLLILEFTITLEITLRTRLAKPFHFVAKTIVTARKRCFRHEN